MDEASKSAAAGDRSKAGSSQSGASQSLEQAQKALEKVADETGDDADAKRRLKELEAEQKAIREKMKQLRDLLEKADNDAAKKSAKGAQQKMEDAEQSLEAGSSGSASESAEEARRYLEQAKQDLEREKRRYEALRQEEMMFKLVQDLKEFRTDQDRIRDETKKIADAVAGGTLAHGYKAQLRRLAAEETTLKSRLDERVKAIREERSPAFGTSLEIVGVDMAEVARLLENMQSDAYVQGLESEVSSGLTTLVQAFEDEIKRRSEKGGGKPPPPGSGQARAALVPPIVEIKLMRRLQGILNTKLETFWSQNPGVREGKIDDKTRRVLESLYHQQQTIADALEALKQSVYPSKDK
jgi:chromosome segregation ATPase